MSQKVLKIGTSFCANGLQAGSLVTILGEAGSGKTSAVLQTIAECQQQGGVAAYIDTQGIFDPQFARRLGVNTGDLLVSQPSNAEKVFEIVRELVKTAEVNVIVVDSVCAMWTQAQIESPNHVIFQSLAGLLSKAIPMINSEMRHGNTIVIFTASLRQLPDGGWDGPTGLSLSSPIILEMQRGENIKEGEETVGFHGSFVVSKNIPGAELTVSNVLVLLPRPASRSLGPSGIYCKTQPIHNSKIYYRRGEFQINFSK